MVIFKVFWLKVFAVRWPTYWTFTVISVDSSDFHLMSNAFCDWGWTAAFWHSAVRTPPPHWAFLGLLLQWQNISFGVKHPPSVPMAESLRLPLVIPCNCQRHCTVRCSVHAWCGWMTAHTGEMLLSTFDAAKALPEYFLYWFFWLNLATFWPFLGLINLIERHFWPFLPISAHWGQLKPF